jgi:2-octaprenyl-6-methoxyphenol hydroxylase
MPARATAVELSPDAVQLSIESHAAESPRAVSARLLVAADGAGSGLRGALGLAAHTEDYGQVALIANVGADRPHEGIAYERFTPTGPLALLPLADGAWGLVWTLEPARAAAVLEFSDDRFLHELQQCFGWRAGRFTRVGRRAAYPLQLNRAEGTVASRAVLIGNAAQALHPVAGQGFNLGLRDAATLAELLADARAAAPGGSFDAGQADLLAAFAARRNADRGGVVRFTDGLVKLFGNRMPGVGAARDLGLLLFDLSPTAKSAMSRVSWGFAGETPRLARGLALAR